MVERRSPNGEGVTRRSAGGARDVSAWGDGGNAWGMRELPVEPRPMDGFERLLGPDAARDLTPRLKEVGRALDGRSVWNVNSTESGGGVAEMLGSLLGYAAGAGVDARRLVVDGDEAFFELTKRIHNRLHGDEGDGGDLGDDERRCYESVLGSEASQLSKHLREGDVVILHDPQTAGLADAAKGAGATVVWRCHVGVDRPDDVVRSAWSFLRAYVERADAQVFTRKAYVWDGLDGGRVAVIAPSIDAFAPKNRDLD